MTKSKKPLAYDEIKLGMKVTDADGAVGKVAECNDIHNVLVKYDDNAGLGFYCLDKKCKDYIHHLYAVEVPATVKTKK